jgi:hypothetical protein
MDLNLEIPARRAAVTAAKTRFPGESIYALANTVQRVMVSVNSPCRAAICRASRSKRLVSVSVLYVISFPSTKLLLVASASFSVIMGLTMWDPSPAHITGWKAFELIRKRNKQFMLSGMREIPLPS